jgi:hypothetical protein
VPLRTLIVKSGDLASKNVFYKLAISQTNKKGSRLGGGGLAKALCL